MRDSHALDADYAGVGRKRKPSKALPEGEKKSRRCKRARRPDNLEGKPDEMPTNDHGATFLALCDKLMRSEDKELEGLPIELESNTEGALSQVRGPDEPLAGEGPVQPEAAGATAEGPGGVNTPAAVPGSRKSWSCVCGIAFTRERDLVRHQRSALIHGGGGYKCRHCDRVLTVMHSLKRHEKACPALKAARAGKAFDPDAKTRGRPAGRRNGASSTGAAGQS